MDLVNATFERVVKKMCDAMEAFMAEGKGTILLTDEETRELARRVRLGDHDAVNELVEHNRPLVKHLAKRVLGRRFNADDFMDDVQDGMVVLWKAALMWDPDDARKAKFSTYVSLSVARKLLAKNRRRVAREEVVQHLAFDSEDLNVMEDPESDILVDIRDAVNNLPDEERILVRQHYYEGRNLEDIGRDIGVSHTTAWKRIRRGVAKVREAVMA